MSIGGGGIIILANLKATMEDPTVQSLTPPHLLHVVLPIIAKSYDQWTEVDRLTIAGVVLTLAATVAIT